MKTIIKNATIITPDAFLENHWLLLENDRIMAIGSMTAELPLSDCSVDVSGAMVLPGLIDIHSDMIEQLIQPRSTAIMDFGMSLAEAEKQLAACGITTIFHSISMYQEGTWDVKEIRQAPHVKKLADLIHSLPKQAYLINHKYHLRYEINNIACYNDVSQMLQSGKVQLLSFMDHTPKQGQYKNLTFYRRHLPSEGKNLTDSEFAALIQKELHRPKLSRAQLKILADIAQKKNISIASHDDDTVGKLHNNLNLGVKISEFPITLEVAKAACAMGLKTVLGAPNVLLGGSHSGNLAAAEAVKVGCAAVLCSDYYPQALLRAIFKLSEDLNIPLYDTCKLATLSPAEATGISKDYGSLEQGKKADLIIVNKNNAGQPQLIQTWVNGVCVMNFKYHIENGAQ